MRNINWQKYRQALLTFLIICNNAHLGKTKLMKLLYYLDFDHFEKYGTSVTGETYRRRQHGPFPSNATSLLQSMERDGLIERETVVVGTKTQVRYSVTQQGMMAYDPGIFSDTESEILDAVSQEWKDVPGKAMVDMTHQEPPWKNTADGQVISYDRAYERRKYGLPPLSAIERDYMIRSVIASQALEGVEVSYETASELLDEVLREPLIHIGQ